MTLSGRVRHALTWTVPAAVALAALGALAGTGVLGPHHSASSHTPAAPARTLGTPAATPTASPTAGTTASPSAEAAAPDSPSAAAPADLDLHSVDWKNVALPGETCFSDTPIQLHDARAVLPAAPHNHEVMLDLVFNPSAIAYGPVEGDGSTDAALLVDCSNQYSNASGILRDSMVVFSGRGGELHALGVLLPGVQPSGDVLPTSMATPTITDRQLTVPENFWGPYDTTASPSGVATTVFTWTGSGFTSATTIERQPLPAPIRGAPSPPPHF